MTTTPAASETPLTDALELSVSRGMLGTQLFKEVRTLERQLLAAEIREQGLRDVIRGITMLLHRPNPQDQSVLMISAGNGATFGRAAARAIAALTPLPDSTVIAEHDAALVERCITLCQEYLCGDHQGMIADLRRLANGGEI